MLKGHIGRFGEIQVVRQDRLLQRHADLIEHHLVCFQIAGDIFPAIARVAIHPFLLPETDNGVAGGSHRQRRRRIFRNAHALVVVELAGQGDDLRRAVLAFRGREDHVARGELLALLAQLVLESGQRQPPPHPLENEKRRRQDQEYQDAAEQELAHKEMLG